MRKKILGLVGLILLFSATIDAAPDPRDSVILESKCVLPNLTGSPAFVLKIFITNKDSLHALVVALRESTIAGTAYVLLSTPRNFSGVVNRLTSTLRFFNVINLMEYNDNSPDRFSAVGVYDPFDPANIEPPNAVRKAFWELKFGHSSDSTGLVEFDSTRVANQPTGFINTESRDIQVNFVKSVVAISTGPTLLLAEPASGSGICQLTPKFVWQLCSPVPDSLSATYRVVLADNSEFSPADTSPVLSETTYTFPDSLVIGHSYFWKVTAILDNGDTIVGVETRSFSILVNRPPNPFMLALPLNGTKFFQKAINFDWQDALLSDPCNPADMVRYTLYVSSDSTFVSGFIQPGLTTSAFTLPGGAISRGARYFWRVKASDIEDSSRFSTDIRYFDFFKLGDANIDLKLTPTDAVLLLNNLYLGTPLPLPRVVDMNCDISWTVADVVIALNVIFLAEPPPCDP